MRRLIELTLENPVAFELQQRYCNDYKHVRSEFEGFVDGQHLNILDVGCSTGTCAGQIIDMENNNYTGIDVVPRYVEIAQQRYPSGKFIAMDARRMSFDAASFDIAMFIGVLHHMSDGLATDCLADVRRVLNPSGYVVVAEPVFTAHKPLSNLLLSLDRGRHIRSEAGYLELFAGYEIVRQRFFRLSIHRFCSFILRPASPAGASS